MPKTLLLRRLERLEALSEPSEIHADEMEVQIVYVDGDGTKTSGGVFHLRDKGRHPSGWRRRVQSQIPGQLR